MLIQGLSNGALSLLKPAEGPHGLAPSSVRRSDWSPGHVQVRTKLGGLSSPPTRWAYRSVPAPPALRGVLLNELVRVAAYGIGFFGDGRLYKC